MLSVVIVNYKNPALLRLCLRSLAKVISPSFRHEIIVVDIASDVETKQVVLEFPSVRSVAFKQNIGYTRGVNEGIKAARGDAVFIANSDIIPLEGSLESMYAYLKDHHEIGMLGPQLLNFNGSRQQSCFRFYTPLTIACRRTVLGSLPFGRRALDRFAMADKDLSKPMEADWLMGSALMVSKRAIDNVGLMDESLFLYMSDVDWPRQFWENGYRVVFYPEARMYHYHMRESRSRLGSLDALFNRQTRQHIKDAIRYFRKNGLHHLSHI